METILTDAPDMQLLLIQPDDDTDYPIRFQSRCRRCGLVVAETTYDKTLEADPDHEQRLEQDAARDSVMAMRHLCQ